MRQCRYIRYEARMGNQHRRSGPRLETLRRRRKSSDGQLRCPRDGLWQAAPDSSGAEVQCLVCPRRHNVTGWKSAIVFEAVWGCPIRPETDIAGWGQAEDMSRLVPVRPVRSLAKLRAWRSRAYTSTSTWKMSRSMSPGKMGPIELNATRRNEIDKNLRCARKCQCESLGRGWGNRRFVRGVSVPPRTQMATSSSAGVRWPGTSRIRVVEANPSSR